MKASSKYVITAPSEAEIRYDLDVVVLGLRVAETYRLVPWLRITANKETDEVTCSAGIRGERKPSILGDA